MPSLTRGRVRRRLIEPAQFNIITPPTEPLITLDDFRAHLNLEQEDVSDDFLTGMADVEGYLEELLRRPVQQQTWDFMFNVCLPADNDLTGFDINFSPVETITWIRTYDENGDFHEIDTTKYQVFGLGDAPPLHSCEIYPVGRGWDVEEENRGSEFNPYPVRIEAEVGWRTIPSAIRQAALGIGADWFSQRRSGVSVPIFSVPHGSQEVIRHYRRQENIFA